MGGLALVWRAFEPGHGGEASDGDSRSEAKSQAACEAA
jgi:hypothetical protein